MLITLMLGQSNENGIGLNVTECIVCVQGYDSLTFSFRSSFLFLIGSFMAPVF